MINLDILNLERCFQAEDWQGKSLKKSRARIEGKKHQVELIY